MNFEKEIRAALEQHVASDSPGWLQDIPANFYSRMRAHSTEEVIRDLEKLNFDVSARVLKWMDTEATMAAESGSYHHYTMALMKALEAENKALKAAAKKPATRRAKKNESGS